MHIKDNEFLLHEETSLSLTSANSMYVSKAGRTETFGLADAICDDNGEDKVLAKLAKTFKERFNKPVLINTVDASHYGYVNYNFSMYDIGSIKQNAKTFVEPFPKPVLIHHRQSDEDGLIAAKMAEDPIGRVVKAVPVIYDKLSVREQNDIYQPKGHITVYSVITDKDAIEKIIDGRYLTVSIGSGVDVSSIRCSVCGRNPARDEECEHKRGQTYVLDEENGKSKKPKKELCYYVFGGQRYKEYSFVNTPADDSAINKKFIIANEELMQDSETSDDQYENFDRIAPKFSFYLGSKDKGQKDKLVNIIGEEINIQDILNPSFRCIDDICSIVKPGHEDTEDTTQEPVVEDQVTEPETKDDENENIDNNDDGGEAVPCVECNDKVRADYAQLHVLEGLIATEIITDVNVIKDAISETEIADNDVVSDLSTVADLKDYISDLLDEIEDAKLTTTSRKKLPSSAFCGPNRSWPAHDCAHVRTARAFLKDPAKSKNLSSSQKASVRACVNKHAARLGCDSSSDAEVTQLATQDNTSTQPTEAKMEPKYTFQSKDEILGSSTVTSYIGKLQAEHDEVVDGLKAEIEDLQNKVKATMVDEIVANSISLKIAKVKPYLEADSDEAKTKALDAYKTELQGKSLEVLDTMREFTRDELAARPAEEVKPDPVTQSIQDQTNGDNGTTTTTEADTATTDTQADTQTEETDTSTSDNTPPDSELNNPNTETQDNTDSTNSVKSLEAIFGMKH